MDWFEGKVLWFNDEKGFGYIVDDICPDKKYFVHYQAIKTSKKWKTLNPGDKVKAREIKESKFGLEVREVKEI